MKLKRFPSEMNVRNVFARLTTIVLSMSVLAALFSVVSGFGMGELGTQDTQFLLASLAFPLKFEPVERKSDEDFLSNLQTIAFLDPLTGLKNRRGLEGQISSILSEEFDPQNRVAVMLLDLDRFKFVNDTFGHDAGDQILRDLAQRLRNLIDGDPDMTCYRLGGDEFLILWAGGPSFTEVDAFCNAVKRCLLEPHFIDRSEIEGGGSVGVTWQNKTDTQLGMMLKRADMALYKAKSVPGSAHRFFCKQLEIETQNKRDTEDVVRAIVVEQSFDIKYEPIAYADDLELNHFEVNVLKQGFDSHLLANEEYVDALNETSLIIPFNRVVLEGVIQDMAAWNKQSKAVINMSSTQLLDPNFVPYLSQALCKNKIEGNRIVIAFDTLERTENPELIETNLRGLSDLGVRIASYGFGGDISNFIAGEETNNKYLILKENWLKSVTEDASSFELLKNLIRLAQGLGLRIIVQGVETAAQVKHLSSLPNVLVKGNAVRQIESPL